MKATVTMTSVCLLGLSLAGCVTVNTVPGNPVPARTASISRSVLLTESSSGNIVTPRMKRTGISTAALGSEKETAAEAGRDADTTSAGMSGAAATDTFSAQNASVNWSQLIATGVIQLFVTCAQSGNCWRL